MYHAAPSPLPAPARRPPSLYTCCARTGWLGLRAKQCGLRALPGACRAAEGLGGGVAGGMCLQGHSLGAAEPLVSLSVGRFVGHIKLPLCNRTANDLPCPLASMASQLQQPVRHQFTNRRLSLAVSWPGPRSPTHRVGPRPSWRWPPPQASSWWSPMRPAPPACGSWSIAPDSAA